VHARRAVAGALWTLLLLLSTRSPTSADGAKDMTAILLVAQDDLTDPDFADSIVLVMNNLGAGPVGFILNRPTRIAVSELASQLFPNLKRLPPPTAKVYFGGPVVEGGAVWFLFRAATPPEHAIRAFDGIYVSGDRDLLRRLLSRDKPMEGLRVYVGQSGWAPGQLQAEIAHGDWKLKRADAEAIFNGKSDHPWPAPQAPNGTT
jgi:putative transcriptional regulator